MKNPSFGVAVFSGLLLWGGMVAHGQRLAYVTEVQNRVLVAVSSQEAESHRIGPPPILRIELDSRRAAILGTEGIAVKVTVSPEGDVTSAQAAAQDAPADLRTQAEALASKVRYRPFELDGHAIWATFEDRIGVLPPELKPVRHIPFPEVHDWNAVVITLTRTGCFGTCPSYRVEMHGDGAVLYEGTAFVAINGKHRCTISQERFRELVNLFREADYFSLRDEYIWGATDLPTFSSSITIDGQSKKLEDYAGVMIGMPMAVSDLESSIDRLSEVERWTVGSAETVRCLQDEHWDFHSADAAQALVEITKSGPVEAVRDLVAAGVPLNGQDDQNQTALTRAAFRGDVRILQILLAAGAAKVDPRGLGTALEMAAFSGKNDAMNLLLAFGATANTRNSDGRTLLMSAAASGVPSVVGRVLKSHPDVNARDNEGRTSLMAAVGQYHYGAVRPEIKRAEVVRLLIQAGADPNARDEKGNTALIETGWDADAALVLLRAGADVNAQSKEGYTALINCAAPEVARVLLENGADASTRDKKGRTALDLAKLYSMKEKQAVLETYSGGTKP
jgi:ankyrin repeat protein